MSLHQGYPTMTEPVSHIPRNQQEMDRVKEGELVLLTFGDVTFWTLFEGKNNESKEDIFITQDPDNLKDILEFGQEREIQKYDSQLGILLIKGNYNFGIVDNLYEKRKSDLQNVGLWVDNSVVGAKK